jgi:5S rRNA maturation endonuclease (ribonuclease M5)
LREAASKGTLVVVEGEKDVKALRRLGIEGNFQKLSSGGTLLNFLEGLSGHRDIILLTDFDRAGTKLLNFCAEHLKRIGTKPDIEFWKGLRKLVHKDVKDIQGLAKFVLGQRAKIRGWHPSRA